MACERCNDTGITDSGGVTPWGESVNIPCECSHKWYSVTYYTLSDCKNSVDVLASSATEAEIIARRKDECFDKLVSCAYLPYKQVKQGVYCRNCETIVEYGDMKPWRKDNDTVDMLCSGCDSVLVEGE